MSFAVHTVMLSTSIKMIQFRRKNMHNSHDNWYMFSIHELEISWLTSDASNWIYSRNDMGVITHVIWKVRQPTEIKQTMQINWSVCIWHLNKQKRTTSKRLSLLVSVRRILRKMHVTNSVMYHKCGQQIIRLKKYSSKQQCSVKCKNGKIFGIITLLTKRMYLFRFQASISFTSHQTDQW